MHNNSLYQQRLNCVQIKIICLVASHKGIDIASVITKCLLDCDLDKVFTVTIDNASSNNGVLKELSKQFSKWGTNMMDDSHLHMKCIAHVFNLIVQEGLKEMGNSVKRVRQVVKRVSQVVRYIQQSPVRLNKFKNYCELQNITCKKSLYFDVSTRWNFTYLMLNKAYKFEDAFSSYIVLDCGLLNYLLTNICEDEKCAGSFLSTD